MSLDARKIMRERDIALEMAFLDFAGNNRNVDPGFKDLPISYGGRVDALLSVWRSHTKATIRNNFRLALLLPAEDALFCTSCVQDSLYSNFPVTEEAEFSLLSAGTLYRTPGTLAFDYSVEQDETGRSIPKINNCPVCKSLMRAGWLYVTVHTFVDKVDGKRRSKKLVEFSTAKNFKDFLDRAVSCRINQAIETVRDGLFGKPVSPVNIQDLVDKAIPVIDESVQKNYPDYAKCLRDIEELEKRRRSVWAEASKFYSIPDGTSRVLFTKALLDKRFKIGKKVALETAGVEVERTKLCVGASLSFGSVSPRSCIESGNAHPESRVDTIKFVGVLTKGKAVFQQITDIKDVLSRTTLFECCVGEKLPEPFGCYEIVEIATNDICCCVLERKEG